MGIIIWTLTIIGIIMSYRRFLKKIWRPISLDIFFNVLYNYLIIECFDVDIHVTSFLYISGKYIIGVNASIFLKMLSKFFRTTYRCNAGLLLTRRVTPKLLNVRCTMIPASQYDIPFPRKLKLGYTLSTYWEIIPLFVTTCISITIMVFSILWACSNKVDIVFTSRSRQNLSRLYDLRNPTVHKLIIINQRYEPWPEMADVLDKMRMSEKRALARLQSCSQP